MDKLRLFCARGLILLLCGGPLFLNAQVKLEVRLTVVSKTNEGIYLAGDFNNWNPGLAIFRFQPAGTLNYKLLLNIPPGKHEFKVTRGSWDKAEVLAGGKQPAPNRLIDLKRDTVIHMTIANWADEFKQQPAQHTFSKNVRILDTAFQMPQLGKKRRIWIYLPAGYQASKKNFPVLYMHDGQNLFDKVTSGYGEWGVDEVLDSLSKNSGKQMIVVGIDHGGKDRITEYNPYDSQYGKGEGKAYVDFLVKTLKPYIDATFRTLKDPGHTAIAGSSMGGLISMYAIARYPEVFGNAGIFSPAFWLAPDLYGEVSRLLPNPGEQRIYFVAGALETKTMLPDLEKMYHQLDPSGRNAKIRLKEASDGKHSEWFWHREFPAFATFIFPN
jgi:predicted alpha/beta superfamily hydrolase